MNRLVYAYVLVLSAESTDGGVPRAGIRTLARDPDYNLITHVGDRTQLMPVQLKIVDRLHLNPNKRELTSNTASRFSAASPAYSM